MGDAAPGRPPGHRGSSVWRRSGTSRVYALPSPSHPDALRGKSAAVDLSAAHLGGHGGHASDSDGANDQRYGGFKKNHYPPAELTGGPTPPPARGSHKKKTKGVAGGGGVAKNTKQESLPGA